MTRYDEDRESPGQRRFTGVPVGSVLTPLGGWLPHFLPHAAGTMAVPLRGVLRIAHRLVLLTTS